MNRIATIVILITLADIVLAQSAIPTPLNAAKVDTVTVSTDDQLKNLRIIDSIRSIENMIHRLKLDYEAKRVELESAQKVKMDDYLKFITAKRVEYKVSDSHEIDVDKGIWVDRKTPPPVVDKK